MAEEKLDRATAERMGYENAIAARTLDVRGSTVEICLFGPSEIYGEQYHVAVHVDCDPNSPNAGSSEMNACGCNLAAAASAYDERVAELSAPEIGCGT